MTITNWRCKACGHISTESELLTAPSPFSPDDTLTACPECKVCDEGFEQLCDEPGCQREATCGWPSRLENRYRRTCFLHMEEL
jgi:hypothetical protein